MRLQGIQNPDDQILFARQQRKFWTSGIQIICKLINPKKVETLE